MQAEELDTTATAEEVPQGEAAPAEAEAEAEEQAPSAAEEEAPQENDHAQGVAEDSSQLLLHATPSQKGARSTPRKTGRPGSAQKVPAFSPIYLSSPRSTPSPIQHTVREVEAFSPQPRSPEAVAAIAEAVARRTVVPASGKGGAPRPHPIQPVSNPGKPKPSPPKAPSHHVPPRPAPKPNTPALAPEASKPFSERAPQFFEARIAKPERPQTARSAPTSPGVKFASARPKSARLASEVSVSLTLTTPLPEKAAVVTDRLYTIPAGKAGTARAEAAKKSAPRPMLAGGGGAKAPPRPLPPVPKSARVSPPSNRRRISPSGGPSKATLAHKAQLSKNKENSAAKEELAGKLEVARRRSEVSASDEQPAAVEA